VLVDDEQGPEAGRAVFVMRHMTVGDAKRYQEAVTRAENKREGEQLYEAVLAAVAAAVADWRNVTDPKTGKPIDYAPERLEDVLTMAEAWELYFRAINGPTTDELKKSRSQSPTSTDASAEPTDAPEAKSASKSPAP